MKSNYYYQDKHESTKASTRVTTNNLILKACINKSEHEKFRIYKKLLHHTEKGRRLKLFMNKHLYQTHKSILFSKPHIKKKKKKSGYASRISKIPSLEQWKSMPVDKTHHESSWKQEHKQIWSCLRYYSNRSLYYKLHRWARHHKTSYVWIVQWPCQSEFQGR